MKFTQNTRNYYDYSEEFDQFQQPIVKAKICGKEVNMLIDTGAMSCVIEDALARRHRLKNNKKTYITTVVDGTNKKTTGKIVKFQIGEKSFVMDMLVSVINVGINVKIDGILGYDFFQKYNIRIDAKRHILYMDNVE